MRAVVISVIYLFVSACAFTVHDVQVDYQYQGDASTSYSDVTLANIDIGDARGVANPRLIMNMKNLNGDTTSGGWQAEMPLAEIVRDAIDQGLATAGAKLDPDAPVQLSGELMQFDTQTIMGFWEGSHKGSLTVRLQLVDVRSGRIVWRDTFIGGAEAPGRTGAAGVFSATLDDLVIKLLGDPYFRQQLVDAGRLSDAAP